MSNTENKVSWWARVIMRGGDPKRPMVYSISEKDKERLLRFLDPDDVEPHDRQSDTSATFFVFDAGDREVAINMEHLVFSQILFDRRTRVETEPGFHGSVDVYLAGMKDPVEFEVPDDGEEGEDDDDEGQFRQLLCALDSNPEKDRYVTFEDIDGEDAYFRVREIAILEVAKSVINPQPLSDLPQLPQQPPETSKLTY